MIKRILLITLVIGLNILFVSSLTSVAAEDPPYGQILPTRCDCESGDPGPGDCQKGVCCEEGTEWACQQDIECGEPFYFPN